MGCISISHKSQYDCINCKLIDNLETVINPKKQLILKKNQRFCQLHKSIIELLNTIGPPSEIKSKIMI